jgi:predicted AAA+ superfamily ATPase
MTNSLAQLCTPRRSVFDRNQRDIVLDITDLVENKIDAARFFEENYVTDGMRRLLRESFRRFERQSEAQGVYVLTQAMGGGKTHNMIALGLLAKHPELRVKVMGADYGASGLGKVRVVGFTGRESDSPLGIWGAIAEQLGKKEMFKDYYSPLQAPGQTAWTNLLKGEPLLILLDELPPYFENARSKAIGNSDLAAVTTTALSNLLVAVGKPELENVCVVISDLRATYQGGSGQVAQALHNFQNEVSRGALMLEPVGANTNEVYHILRTRLFEKLPSEEPIAEVAKAYAQAVRDARQMDVTNASPEQFAAQIRDSYPFHFSIRDLYARFRENPGFQQTRGLIRLMRVLVSRLYQDGGRANELRLIHPYDLDLNDRDTLVEITNINGKLENAIAHDIA